MVCYFKRSALYCLLTAKLPILRVVDHHNQLHCLGFSCSLFGLGSAFQAAELEQSRRTSSVIVERGCVSMGTGAPLPPQVFVVVNSMKTLVTVSSGALSVILLSRSCTVQRFEKVHLVLETHEALYSRAECHAGRGVLYSHDVPMIVAVNLKIWSSCDLGALIRIVCHGEVFANKIFVLFQMQCVVLASNCQRVLEYIRVLLMCSRIITER